jgi:hypothetical protein
MTSDTDFATDTQDSVVDPAYDITNIDDTPEPDRAVGYEPVPRFDMYHVRFEGASSGFSKNKNTPFVRPTALVLAGPEGTVGRLINDDIYFSVSKTVRDKETQEERPRTEDEFRAAVDESRKTLKRIAVRLKLDRPVPPSITADGLKLYAAGFSGREAIVAIRVDKARGDFPARNRIVWRSIAAPTDEPSKPESKFGSALEEAQAAIEKFNAKQKTAAGSKTVKGLAAAKGGDFL